MSFKYLDIWITLNSEFFFFHDDSITVFAAGLVAQHLKMSAHTVATAISPVGEWRLSRLKHPKSLCGVICCLDYTL